MGGNSNNGGNNNKQQQQYCLRWNQHRTNLLSVFDQLLQSEALTDVTLSCQGANIKCHRIVLAASSGYFQHLFLDDLPTSAYASPSSAVPQHPIIVFKDIQLAELKAILEFIYRGEVSVAQDQVGVLLKAAEALKVKGLYSEDANSPAGLSGLSFEPTAAGQHSNSTPFLAKHQQPTSATGNHSSSSGTSTVQQLQRQSAPMCYKRSPIKTPEDKDRDGSSSSEATPPEDDRDEQPQLHHHHHQSVQQVMDRIKTSRSPVFMDPLKDLTPNPSLSAFVNGGGVSGGKGVLGSGLGSGNGQTRPELKRYRQYTRHDIQAAIEAVRSGQSALQASRLYGVPSRTLYDKVKKLGIATGRPYRQSQAIAVAVSLAQAQQASQNGSAVGRLAQQTTGGVRGPSPANNGDDDDSMDVHHHHHLHHPLHHHFRRRPNTLEELSMYFATSPAAAAAAAAELALQQQQQQQQQRAASAEVDDDEDDDDDDTTGRLPAAVVAPMDLSQGYERMLRDGSDVPVDDTTNKPTVPAAPTPAELLSEN